MGKSSIQQSARKSIAAKGVLAEYTAWGNIVQKSKTGNSERTFLCDTLQSFDSFYEIVGPRPTSRHWMRRTIDGFGYWCGKGSCCDCGPLSRPRTCFWVGRDVIAGCGRRNDIPEYSVWKAMTRRCRDKKMAMAHRYVERGIRVCNRWLKSFPSFYADMGPRPADDYEIDRINNDLGYWCGKNECPECGPRGNEPNCRWATHKEQNNNKSSNKIVEVDGNRMTLSQACDAYGVPYSAVSVRINKYGMDIKDALTIPVMNGFGNPDGTVEINGVVMKKSEACAIYGVKYGTVMGRVKKGMSFMQALTHKLHAKKWRAEGEG